MNNKISFYYYVLIIFCIPIVYACPCGYTIEEDCKFTCTDPTKAEELIKLYPDKVVDINGDKVMNIKVGAKGEYICLGSPCSVNGVEISSGGENVQFSDGKISSVGKFKIAEKEYSDCDGCTFENDKLTDANGIEKTPIGPGAVAGGCSQIKIWEDIKFSTEYLEYYRNPKTDILAAGNVEYLGDTMLLSSAEYASFNNGEIVLNDIGQSTFGFDSDDNLNYLNVMCPFGEHA